MWGQWLADSSDCRQIYHLGCWQISDGGSWNSDLRSQTVESGDDDRRSRCGFARRRVIVVGATRIICAEPTPRPGRANKKKVTSDCGAEPRTRNRRKEGCPKATSDDRDRQPFFQKIT